MKDLFVDINKLQKCSRLSEKINKQAKKLEDRVSKAPLSAMDSLKPFIQPKNNIEQILNFYDEYEESTKKIDLERKIVQESLGGKFKHRKLRLLADNDVIGHVNIILSEIKVLEAYQKIKIVKDYLDEANQFAFMVIEAIKRSFFKALENIPDYDPELRKFANFLIPLQKDIDFLAKYTNIIYSKLCFNEIGTNYKLLITRTLNLSSYFYNIFEMNNNILGQEQAQSINEGVTKMLIINVKSTISDVLMVSEKDENPDSIPYLILLSNNLRHTEGEVIVKDLEELFVFKKEINKIISNCLMAYFESLDDLNKPNKRFEAEKLVLTIKSILNSFNDYEGIAKCYLATYGAFFGIKNLEELNTSFSTRVLDKIFTLADSLSGIQRSVYVINNVDIIKTFLATYEDTGLEEIISLNAEKILSIWANESRKRNEKDVSEFIDANVEAQKTYTLPENVRYPLVQELKTIIGDLLVDKTYANDISELYRSIDSLFTAEAKNQ